MTAAQPSLSQSERQIRLRLRDDFGHYAAKVLKIRTKAGSIEPLRLNRAQQYIHERLEEQRQRTGKVRALVLKGRQMGCCLPLETRVITSDYRWVRIDSLLPGDTLLGFDEDAPKQSGNARRMRTALVEAVVRREEPCIRVTFESGATLTLSKKHKMLMKQRGGKCTQWRRAEDFKVGDHMRRVLHAPLDPASVPDSGWAGGSIDCDGSVGGVSARIAFSQIAGPVLERYRRFLDAAGVNYYELADARECGVNGKLGRAPVHCLRVDKFADIVRVFSLAQPCKLRDVHSGRKLPTSGTGFTAWDKIVLIESVGAQPVVDLQTSTKTFIAEGYASHNSTYVEARYYWRVTHRTGVRAFILTHEAESTAALFEMVQRYHELCHPLVKPSTGASSAKELVFDKLDSAYKVGTAGNKGVGRGTTIQYMHASEVSYWPHASEHARGILQAVPDEADTEVILESTANGVGDYFHEQWQLAEQGATDFQAIFTPWYWQPEYRTTPPADWEPDEVEHSLAETYGLDAEQLAWRRRKIAELSVGGTDGEAAFKVEYPLTAQEAFAVSGTDSLISPESVAKARIRKVLGSGPLVIGVDPARYGDDSTAIIRRKGRAAYKLERYSKRSTMEVAGIVHSIIKAEKPAQVAIDVGGLGAGVVDRLLELGHEGVVVPINFGSAALDPNTYVNRRAEMWYLMRDWLDGDMPVMVPDDDALHSDLCGVRYIYDSNSRRKIESKEAMRKRGIRSPDSADALALTLAEPVKPPRQARYHTQRNVPPVADAVAGY